jgi:hypothetical protein
LIFSGSQLDQNIDMSETRRGRPACGKAHFRPVFRDREGGSCAHPLVTLGRTVDWGFLEKQSGEVYTDDPGRPPLPTRLTPVLFADSSNLAAGIRSLTFSFPAVRAPGSADVAVRVNLRIGDIRHTQPNW